MESGNSDLIYEGQILNLKGSMISRGKKALFGRMKPKSRENLDAASGIKIVLGRQVGQLRLY